jgi:hypothetical protein
LTAPHSPVLPHTPIPAKPPPSALYPSYQSHTPYTPFTSFAAKQISLDANNGIPLSTSQTPDDADDPLARLYNQILRFVERDLTKIMDIAEKVSVKSHPLPRTRDTESDAVETSISRSGKRFDILANVIWAEIGKAIMDELGGVIFAVGKPEEFRKVGNDHYFWSELIVLTTLLKHHETTQAFLRSLEFLAPSIQAVEAMRLHPIYLAFERRWQLPVYFQLRWKEIVSKVEETLSAKRPDWKGLIIYVIATLISDVP